jgi:hypothetical protein
MLALHSLSVVPHAYAFYLLALPSRLCDNDYIAFPLCCLLQVVSSCLSVVFDCLLQISSAYATLLARPLSVAYIAFFCTSLSLMLNSLLHFCLFVTYTVLSESRLVNFFLYSINFLHFLYLTLILDFLNSVLPIRHVCWII